MSRKVRATSLTAPKDLPESRRWLSQKEAAELLGFTDRTVREYIRRGKLKAYKPPSGRAIRIERSELERFMTQRPVAAGALPQPQQLVGRW